MVPGFCCAKSIFSFRSLPTSYRMTTPRRVLAMWKALEYSKMFRTFLICFSSADYLSPICSYPSLFQGPRFGAQTSTACTVKNTYIHTCIHIYIYVYTHAITSCFRILLALLLYFVNPSVLMLSKNVYLGIQFFRTYLVIKHGWLENPPFSWGISQHLRHLAEVFKIGNQKRRGWLLWINGWQSEATDESINLSIYLS